MYVVIYLGIVLLEKESNSSLRHSSFKFFIYNDGTVKIICFNHYRFIFQKSLGFSREELDDEEIFHFQSDIGKTISTVDSGSYQMAFLLNPTKIEHVKEVTGHSLIMPRKSTYFYPKVLTGLVFNRIDPNEIIQIP